MLCAERSILVFVMKNCVVNKAKFVCVCVCVCVSTGLQLPNLFGTVSRSTRSIPTVVFVYHSHSPGVRSGKCVNSCLNVDGNITVYVEKCEPSQTRVGHGKSEGSLNSFQPTEGSFGRARRVERILTRAIMLGNMGLTCLKVSARFVGKLLSPCSRSCCCYFIFQMCSSISKQSRDVGSSSYSSAGSLTLKVQSAD